MLETYDYEQLRTLSGHEVVAEDGEKVGYVDLIFRDNDTGEPEWLGIWDGLPDTKPRVLVPVRGVGVEGDVVRIPWPAELVRNAPPYEAPHGLVMTREHVVEVDAETERNAYEHYGIEPATTRPDDVELVRFTVWRIQTF